MPNQKSVKLTHVCGKGIYKYYKYSLQKLRRPYRLIQGLYWHFLLKYIVAIKEKIVRRSTELRKEYSIIYSLGDPKSNSRKALLVYVVDPFTEEFSPELARSHANYQKSPAIVEILSEFGFSVDVTDWQNIHAPQADNYGLVIGQGRAFAQSCKHCQQEIPRIYLGWGLPAQVTQKAVRLRSQEISKKRRVNLFQDHPSEQGLKFATDIFYLGNSYTQKAYQSMSIGEVFQLYNPVVQGVKPTLDQKDFSNCRRHFMWMAAYGTARRCLDILLEVFSENPQFDLWICGGLEHEKVFFKAYKKEILSLQNIHYMGWLDVTSSEYDQVTAICGYMLYPSISDGMPGSVVNSMFAGVVPIVTKESGMDLRGLGIEISTLSHSAVLQIIRDAASIAPEKLAQESYAVHQFAASNHSQEAFNTSFRKALEKVLLRHQMFGSNFYT